jgi:hypothetical protein
MFDDEVYMNHTGTKLCTCRNELKKLGATR